MDDLIEALTILRKYIESESPTECRDGLLYVPIDKGKVSQADVATLKTLGFYTVHGGFSSLRFGGYKAMDDRQRLLRGITTNL